MILCIWLNKSINFCCLQMNIWWNFFSKRIHGQRTNIKCYVTFFCFFAVIVCWLWLKIYGYHFIISMRSSLVCSETGTWNLLDLVVFFLMLACPQKTKVLKSVTNLHQLENIFVPDHHNIMKTEPSRLIPEKLAPNVAFKWQKIF